MDNEKDILNMVATRPFPGMASASSICFSPDSKYLTFLHTAAAVETASAAVATDSNGASTVSENAKPALSYAEQSTIESQRSRLVQQLYGLKIQHENGTIVGKPFVIVGASVGGASAVKDEENMSLEEKLRRERQRNLNLGVTSYTWGSSSEDGTNLILVPLGGDIYLKQMNDENNSDLVLAYDHRWTSLSNIHGTRDEPPGPCLDAELSPDGSLISFVQNQEIFVVSVDACLGKEDHDSLKSDRPKKKSKASATKVASSSSSSSSEKSASAVQLTSDSGGPNLITNGLADFIAQEELDRFDGYWWSPDSSMLAFEQFEEGHIPEYTIQHQGNDNINMTQSESHRYPFSGEKNPIVRVGVLKVSDFIKSGGSKKKTSTIWLDLSFNGDENHSKVDSTTMMAATPSKSSSTTPSKRATRHSDNANKDAHAQEYYYCRGYWLPDNSICCEILNRAQTELRLVRYDPLNDWKPQLLLIEKTNVWINLHKMFRVFTLDKNESQPKSYYIIWASERSGFMHLYLYYFNGTSCSLVRQLTEGNWMVESVCAVDKENKIIYFQANKDDPLSSHIFALDISQVLPHKVSATAGEDSIDSTPLPFVCLTSGLVGSNQALINLQSKSIVITHTSHLQPASIKLYALPNRDEIFSKFNNIIISTIAAQSQSNTHKPSVQMEQKAVIHDSLNDKIVSIWKSRDLLRPPEVVSFPLPTDPSVTLYGALHLPLGYDPAKDGPLPTVVFVYGGPHVQRVKNEWLLTCEMRAQYYAKKGFAVFKCDNRGSSRRGVAFESAIKHKMGTVEIDDQAAGIDYLISKGIADKNRIGIVGWSYGGYMSIMALLKRPDLFKVGVSGAPVTSWKLYDTAYTERYMGTPAENERGYREGSCLTYADKLQGKLLLIHGLIDENVLFRHTAAFINALVAARKPYDLLLFPDERHSPRRQEDRVYMEQRICEYFVEHLMKA